MNQEHCNMLFSELLLSVDMKAFIFIVYDILLRQNVYAQDLI